VYVHTKNDSVDQQRQRIVNPLNTQLYKMYQLSRLKIYTICGSTYTGNAKIAAALRVDGARLEERLARLLPASFKSFAAGSGGSESDEGHSKENGGFEELHGCGSEDLWVN